MPAAAGLGGGQRAAVPGVGRAGRGPLEPGDQLVVATLQAAVGDDRRLGVDAPGADALATTARSARPAPRPAPGRRRGTPGWPGGSCPGAGRSRGCGRRAARGTARTRRPRPTSSPRSRWATACVAMPARVSASRSSRRPSCSSSAPMRTRSSRWPGWLTRWRAASSTVAEHVRIVEVAGDRLGAAGQLERLVDVDEQPVRGEVHEQAGPRRARLVAERRRGRPR